MTTVDFKAAQLAKYKEMIVEYLQTEKDAPWKSSLEIGLNAISNFLTSTAIITEDEKNAIIKEARELAKITN